MIVVYWHSYALFTGRHYYCLPMTQRYTTQRSTLCVDPTNQLYYPSLVGGESVATEAIARPTLIMIFELTTFFRERSNELRGLVELEPYRPQINPWPSDRIHTDSLSPKREMGGNPFRFSSTVSSNSNEGFWYIRMEPGGNIKLYLQTPSRFIIVKDFFVDFFNDI
jgi:hypothetical protein